MPLTTRNNINSSNGIQLSIGADPEFAVFDRELKEFVSAHDLVPGTKETPYELEKGSVQADGTLVEIGIDPAISPTEFVRNTSTVLKQVRQILGDRYELRCGNIISYSEEQAARVPPHLWDVGCSPQYRLTPEGGLVVMQGQQKIHPSEVPMGGHIHIGLGEDFDITDPQYIREIREITSLLHSAGCIPSAGGPGASIRSNVLGMAVTLPVVRVKSYGVEFRNPGSYWLSTQRTAFRTAAAVFDGLRKIIPLFSQTRYHERHVDTFMCPLLDKAEAQSEVYQRTLPVMK